MRDMSKFDEFKEAYRVIKKEYGYLCEDILPPDEDNENYEFIFGYQGFPVKTYFLYMWFDTPYPEVDKVVLWRNCDDDYAVELSVACYFAITNLIKAFQDCRSDKETMLKIIDYLNDEVLNG